MTVKRVLVVALFVGFVVWVVWLFAQHERDPQDACRAAGGVAVTSQEGAMVCVDRDALIPEKEWKP